MKVNPDKVINIEPRMIREDFEVIPMPRSKPMAMDKLILLIKLPKGTKREDVTFMTQSHHDDIIHYVAIGENENMEVEVLLTPPNEISILWGLFKWTY